MRDTTKPCDPSPKTVTHTVADVGKRYGVGTGTVLGWIRAGELAAVNVGRSARSMKPRWRITHAALAAFEAARTATTPTPRVARRAKTVGEVVRFY